MKGFCSIYLLLSVLTIHAFPIYIKVYAPNHIDHNVRWLKKTDYITNTAEIINETKVDSNGYFYLNGQFNETELTEIAIGRSSGLLYIDSITKNYEIVFPKDSLFDQNSLKKSSVQLIFLNLPKKDINTLLLNFNLYFDFFLYGDTSKLIRMAHHDAEFQDSLNQFKIFVSKKYGDNNIKYLHNYIRYEIALLEQMAHQSKGEYYKFHLYNTYLKKHAINYNNDAYMQFFNLFYKDPFRVGGAEIYEKVRFAINNYNEIDKVKEALENCPYFTNKQISELAIIKGLYDAYNNSRFDLDHLLNMLEEIAKTSQWSTHQKIAKNTIKSIKKLHVGEPIPNLEIINQHQEIINIDQHKSKYIYIHFFATWNQSSLQEMEIIEKLNAEYDFVQFISISLDHQNNDLKEFLNENSNYKWDICYANNDQKIIDD